LSRQSQRAEKWREKSLLQSEEIRKLNIKVSDLTQNAPKPHAHQLPKDVNLAGFKFNLSIVWLSIILYKGGLSYRAISSMWVFLSGFFGVSFAIPSYGTVRTWVLKHGLYLLKKGGKSLRKGGEKWVFIIDESYSLGKSRLLVILAIRVSSLKSGKALTLSDVHPIEIRSGATWKTEEVAEVLKSAIKKTEGAVQYVVADRGSNIVSACKACGLRNVPDWSHYIANILENIYAKNVDFIEYNDNVGKFKRKRKQSEFSQYSPPNLSVKIRFMNYIPFLEWSNIMLKNFKKLPSELTGELQFLKQHEILIGELTDLFFGGHKIGVILKSNGICQETKGAVMKIKGNILKKHPNNQRVLDFAKGIDEYFDMTMPIYRDCIQKNAKTPPDFNAILASSDIIESIFGKFKHRCLKDPKRGFSAITLLIPLFCWNFSPFDVFKAMKTISIEHLEQWEKKNLSKKGYKSFRNVFKGKNKKRTMSSDAV
jgi:hypothetical protein